MRKVLWGAALIAALAAPGVAQAQSGHVEAEYAARTYDLGGFELDVDATSIGAQVAFGGELGVQIDGGYTNWGGDVDDVAEFAVGAHVFKRSGSWLFGGYVGYEDIDDFNFESWTVALESQYYLDRSTISGVLSHSEWDGPDYSITMLEGEYRYFVSDNFSVHGGLGIGQGDIGTSDPDIWSAAVGGEYMFTGAPISIYGQYWFNSLDFGPGELEVDALSVGVRYNWGGSLIERDRNGAGLRRVPSILERFLT